MGDVDRQHRQSQREEVCGARNCAHASDDERWILQCLQCFVQKKWECARVWTETQDV